MQPRDDLESTQREALMPLKIFAGRSHLTTDGNPVRTLVAANSQHRARELLERVSVHVSVSKFSKYWPVTERLYEHEMATEEGIWLQTQTDPPEYQRLDWSVGRLYDEEDGRAD